MDKAKTPILNIPSNSPLTVAVNNNPIIGEIKPLNVLTHKDEDFSLTDNIENQYSFIHPYDYKVFTGQVVETKTFNQNTIIKGREAIIQDGTKKLFIRYQLPPVVNSGDVHTNIYIDKSYLQLNDTPASTKKERNNAMYVLGAILLLLTISGIFLLNSK